MDQSTTATESADVSLPWGKIGEIGLAVADFRQGQEVFHSHAFHEMVLVRSGSGVHITEDFQTKIYRGDIFLVTPGYRHTYENVKNLLITNILYIPERLGIPVFDLKETFGYYAFFEAHPRVSGRYHERYTLSLNDIQFAEAESLIVEIEQMQRLMKPGNEYFRKVAFMRLVGLICQSVTDSKDREIGELTDIAKIMRFFDKNYPDEIRVDDLVPVCGKSASSITRMFRKSLGQSPIDYLITLRMEKAAALLREKPARPIHEIAFLTGFRDSNYFCKMFHRRFNRSPRDYRKEESLTSM